MWPNMFSCQTIIKKWLNSQPGLRKIQFLIWNLHILMMKTISKCQEMIKVWHLDWFFIFLDFLMWSVSRCQNQQISKHKNCCASFAKIITDHFSHIWLDFVLVRIIWHKLSTLFQDLQCGSKSLLVQVCDDIAECLYFGDESLVQSFLSEDGIRFQQIGKLLQEGDIENIYFRYFRIKIEQGTRTQNGFFQRFSIMVGGVHHR